MCVEGVWGCLFTYFILYHSVLRPGTAQYCKSNKSKGCQKCIKTPKMEIKPKHRKNKKQTKTKNKNKTNKKTNTKQNKELASRDGHGGLT